MRSLFSNLYIPKGAMADASGKLSNRTQAILQKLSAGQSSEQILKENREFECADIARAANEALVLNNAVRTRAERLAAIQQRYPRAYEKWSREEERKISALYRAGKTITELAMLCQRQPNAIKSRLERLGVRGPLASQIPLPAVLAPEADQVTAPGVLSASPTAATSLA